MSWLRTIPFFALMWVLAAVSGCSTGPNYGASWVEQVMAEPEECPT